MSRKLNLTGKRFGRLLVVRESTSRGYRNRVLWETKCDCGGGTISETSHLRSGESQSCGKCTRSENLEAIRPILRGEQQPTAKLTEDDVLSIRATYNTGDWTQYELAAEYNVWQSCISKVLLRKSWAHL